MTQTNTTDTDTDTNSSHRNITKAGSSFWSQKPLFISAPMSNISDAAMRRILASCGKPDIIYTEFVAVNGLCSQGREKLLPDLAYSEGERPIVAQLFGRKPEHFREAGALVRELGFDGIDINLGCPDKNVLKQGAGSALIGEKDLVGEILSATKEGSGLPVSLKTRIGREEDETEDWIAALAAMKPAALILHGRTRRAMYRSRANWDSIALAAQICHEYGLPLIGNGDITSFDQAREFQKRYHTDGIMVGRALLGNPWFFNEQNPKESLPLERILTTLLEHARLYEALYSDPRAFKAIRKHLKSYLHDFPGAKQLRNALVHSENAAEVERIIEEFMPVAPDKH